MDGRIDSQMVGPCKITPNRWMDGELNDQHKDTTPDGWMDRELKGQDKNKPK